MEGTINSMMTALRSAIYPIVVIAIISAWFMFDDSMNPHLEGGKTWRGMIALPFYAGSMIVMMVINGTSFYVCAWSYFMGKGRIYPINTTFTNNEERYRRQAEVSRIVQRRDRAD